MLMRIVDFVSLGVAIYFASLWGDNVGYHSYIVAALIGLTNLISFIRAKANS
jgi:hypothetical protein